VGGGVVGALGLGFFIYFFLPGGGPRPPPTMR